MRFEAEQTIGTERTRYAGELNATLSYLNRRAVRFSGNPESDLSRLPIGRFRCYAGSYGANWRVTRVA